MDWTTLFNSNLVRWLLDGEPWTAYRTLTWLLDKSENDASVETSRVALVKNPLVERIFAEQNESGYWGRPSDIHTWWPKKDTTFWLLPVLADFGFTIEDDRISRACEYVLSTQLESGAFGWSPSTKPGDCHTAILLESLAKLGLLQDTRVQRAFDWLTRRQRLDGGFWCKDTGQVGKPREAVPSCAFATMFVLGAVAQSPASRNSQSVNKGIDFLFDCWDNRHTTRYAGHDSQVGRGWEKLKYPFTEYRILKFLDVLSQFDRTKPRLRKSEMVQILLSKRNSVGRFTPESIHKTWGDFDFGQTQKPSRWITLLALRILRRIYT